MNLLEYFSLFILCGLCFIYFCYQDVEINKGVGGWVCVTYRNVKTSIYIIYMASKEQLYNSFISPFLVYFI